MIYIGCVLVVFVIFLPTEINTVPLKAFVKKLN